MAIKLRSALPDQLSSDQRRRLRWIYRRLRIEVLSSWWWRVRPGWAMRERRLADDFFFIPMTHQIDARVGRARATVLPGQCMFVREGALHSSDMPADCSEMHITSIHAHILPQWGGTLEQVVSRPFQHFPDFAATQSRIERVTHLMHADPPLGKLVAEQMIRDWLAFWAIHENRSADPPLGVDQRVAEAVELIHENYDHPLTVEQLAETARLSEAQFRKLFKRAQGIGPKAYIAEYRLKQAAQQLRVSTASAKEIAYDTGFSDAHYFHLMFRKRFGCTPLVFRKQSQRAV